MSKQEIYNYLCENKHKLFNRKGGILNVKHYPIFKYINFDFKNAEELYDFLNESDNIKCRLNTCNNKKKFKSFEKGYNDFCCIECNNKWLSLSRMGKNNPIHKITDENRKKWGEKLSKLTKERIKNGSWTPEITNSWCHSRYKITFERNEKLIKQNVRSSWEAFFQLLNPDFLYEKLRIPYFYKDEWHNYIVDFINVKEKKVVEIKPLSLQKKEKNILKEKALIEWCDINNYQIINITELYFKSKSIKIGYDLIENQPDENRLHKFVKKYFYEN